MVIVSMKWHYVKEFDIPKESCSCLCDLDNKAYEVLFYDTKSGTWYDSWDDRQVTSLRGVVKWISISEIDKETSE